MSRLSEGNNRHMCAEPTRQGHETTACAKMKLSEEETSTGEEDRLLSSMISALRGEYAHQVNTID